MVVIGSLAVFALMAILPIYNKKIKNTVGAVMLGILICIFIGANYSQDQFAYSVLYTDNSYFAVEKGYLFLNKLSAFFGLDYLQFKLVIMLAGSLLIILFLNRIGDIDYRKVLLMWALTGFWFDIEQSRYTIAMILVIYSLKYLKKPKISNAVKYILLLVVASFIHTSVLVYLLFLLVFLPEKILRIIAGVSCVIAATFAFVFTDLSWIGNILYTFIPNERILLWFSYKTNFGWLGPTAVLIALFVIMQYGKRILEKQRSCGNVDENHISFFDLMNRICYLSFAFVPLFVVSTEFIRLIRGLLLLYFVCFCIFFGYAAKKQRLLIDIFGIGFVVLYNLQGLRGILFFNDYFVENLIMQNDLNSNPALLLLILPIVILIFIETELLKRRNLTGDVK